MTENNNKKSNRLETIANAIGGAVLGAGLGIAVIATVTNFPYLFNPEIDLSSSKDLINSMYAVFGGCGALAGAGYGYFSK